jgi:hypothetical protein
MGAFQKKLLTAFSVVLVLQTALIVARYLQGLGADHRFGGDFICFWRAAVLARHGDLAAIYQPDAWRRVLSSRTPTDLSWYVYPPFSLFGVQLLGGLSYVRAVAVWSLAPLPFYFALLVAHARRSEAALARVEGRHGRLGWLGYLALAGMTLPFLSANLMSGQIGAIVAVLMLAAAYFWPDRPIVAGVFIGLLAIKPQVGLLIPFALAAARRWRAMAAAAVTVAGLAVASFVWFGPRMWTDFLEMTGVFTRFIGMGHGRNVQLALAPYLSLLGAGLPARAAAVAQGLISLAVLACVVAAFRRAGGHADGGTDDARLDLRLALLATGAPLATPYALSYESPLLALAVVPLFVRAWRRGWDGWELAAITGLTATPYVQAFLVDWRIPFGLCALLLAFGALGRRYLLDAPGRAPAVQTDRPKPLAVGVEP